MKNIALSLIFLFSLAACSSGTTVADTPFNITGLYNGVFENTAGTEMGTITLNIIEDETSGIISGNIIFEVEDSQQTCFVNGSISGTTSAFSVILTANQSFEVTVTTVSGTVVSTTEFDGTIDYILSQSNDGRNLSGTYITTGNICSNFTGAGTVGFTR